MKEHHSPLDGWHKVNDTEHCAIRRVLISIHLTQLRSNSRRFAFDESGRLYLESFSDLTFILLTSEQNK
jgi:hypothetical protein